ncbi:DUF2933 domain-containing protein [Aquabacterium parvum]|jgi:hypothetical protein|uniref:DUF2933 domain-containing protein n=1 Tax=Aquabacterium parvum TaxID=70584 RepID=UPI000718DA0E|nr:DUF2933 domain-containing protein [Aquabacterium parvum]MBU0915546.1 DUF2933 domain-containing protein [Gammaproteobacteria bacterium]
MQHDHTPASRWRSPLGIFMLVAGALGTYYLLTEHLTHVTQAIPYLVLLACPLMHLFGHHHGGHGGHGRHEDHGQHKAPPEKRD